MPRPRSRAGLNDTTQRLICWHLANGASDVDAARLAGLPDATRLQHYTRTREFAEDLRAAMRDHLAIDLAPRAVQVLNEILNDKNVPPKVRVDAAKAILDRAGFSAAEAAKTPAEKEMAELSLDELHALVAKLEAERAAAAKPVDAAGVTTAGEDARIKELMS